MGGGSDEVNRDQRARLSPDDLRTSDERFRAIFRTMSDAAVFADTERRIQLVNPAFVSMFGYAEGEAVGRSAEMLYADPADFRLLGERRYHSGKEADNTPFEMLYRHKDGTTFWAESLGMQVLGAGGEVTGYVGLHRDITERKRAESALRENEERLRFIVDHSPDNIFLQDTQHRYVWVSKPAAGLNREQYLGHTDIELGERIGSPEAGHELYAVKQRVMEENRGQTLELNLDIRGKRYSFLATYEPWHDKAGAVIGVAGYVHDITDLKRLERERHDIEARLQQTQRLESLGVLAGGIAHDFNNILMVVLGHAELAVDGTLPGSSTRESVSEIVIAAKRAAELCGQMLAYAGKGGIAKSDFSLGELVQNMTSMLKAGLPKNCALNLSLASGVPLINGDPAQIRQVLTSLVINASEAVGQKGGTILISTGVMDCSLGYLANECAVAAGAPGPYAFLEVADTGCGIAASILPRIFEPFFTTKFTGRGLGLSAVLGIVRAHKGAIGVRSELGRGSTFRVLFPVKAGPKRVAPASDSVANWRGQGTVLLVDDESDVLVASRKLLERLGCRTFTARDGQEAVEVYRLRHADVDVVLLDLTMPRMGGEEAYERLRAINPRVRIVVASGYSENDVAARFAGKDLSGCLQKPYTMANLAQILSGLLPSAKPSNAGEPTRAAEGR